MSGVNVLSGENKPQVLTHKQPNKFLFWSEVYILKRIFLPMDSSACMSRAICISELRCFGDLHANSAYWTAPEFQFTW